MFMPTKKVNEIKQQYLVGTRIMMDQMDPSDPRPIPPGTKGTVDYVDDAGQIHCTWDDGRYLAAIPEVDEFHIITD